MLSALVCAGSLLLLGLAGARGALPLPSFMTKCTTRERVALNACALENARRTVKEVAATGERRYGVLPFDPVHVERLVVEQPGFLLEFTDMNMYSDPPGSWSVDSIDLDLDARVLNFRYSTSKFVIKSKYRLDGRILVLTLRGSGDCEVTYHNYSVSNTVNFDVVKNEKDGLEYVKLKNPRLDGNITKSSYQFHNLFGGQETLNKAAHEIANDNWKEIYEDTKESTLEAFGQFVTAVMQAFFNSVPYKDVFPQ